MNYLVKSKKNKQSKIHNAGSYSNLHYLLMKKKLLNKAVNLEQKNNENIDYKILSKIISRKKRKLKSKKNSLSRIYEPSKLRRSFTKKGRFFIYKND